MHSTGCTFMVLEKLTSVAGVVSWASLSNATGCRWGWSWNRSGPCELLGAFHCVDRDQQAAETRAGRPQEVTSSHASAGAILRRPDLAPVEERALYEETVAVIFQIQIGRDNGCVRIYFLANSRWKDVYYNRGAGLLLHH